MSSNLRIRLFVSGHVQGVGFRAAVARWAGARDVSGFARNLADGRVEVVLEGSEAAVQAVAERVRRGPSGALVTHCEESRESPAGERGFKTL